MNWGDNMDHIYIGKVVATHGIKGELRILSDFPFKEKVFVVGNKLFIDSKEYYIQSYRVHKKFDMVTFKGYSDINEVLFLLKKSVYFLKDELKLKDDEILDEELLLYDVFTTDGKKGKIEEIFMASPKNKIIRVLLEKEVLIPMSSPMIKEINKREKKVIIELIEGMM